MKLEDNIKCHFVKIEEDQLHLVYLNQDVKIFKADISKKTNEQMLEDKQYVDFEVSEKYQVIVTQSNRNLIEVYDLKTSTLTKTINCQTEVKGFVFYEDKLISILSDQTLRIERFTGKKHLLIEVYNICEQEWRDVAMGIHQQALDIWTDKKEYHRIELTNDR